MKHIHTFRSIAATSLALLLSGLATIPAHAETESEEIVFSLTPAETEDHPDDRVSIRAEIDPGASYSDSVTLNNYTEQPVTFHLTAADGMTSESGAFDVLSPDAASEGAGTWFELEQETITVAAEDEATVDFTVTVPDNATPGDHPAGITASLAEQAEELNVVSRVGVRTHLRVTGDIVPTLQIDDIETTYSPSWNPFAPGEVTTRYSVTNAGNVRLGTNTTVATSGLFGWNYVSSSIGEVREILPGDTMSFETTNEHVWPLVFGSVDLEAVPKIVGDDEIDAELVSTTHSETIVLISWVWLIIVVLVIGAIMLAIWQRKRRAAKFEAAVAAAAKKQTEQQPTPVA